MRSVSRAGEWPVDNVAVAVVTADGAVRGSHGPQWLEFELASVTKLLSAYAVLVAVEEGALEWDHPAGPEGSTVRHLIAHASGLAFDRREQQASVGARRIYSNTGFEVLADVVARETAIPFPVYLQEAVFEPLGMTDSRLDGSPAAGAVSTGEDLSRFAAELLAPRLVSGETACRARTVTFPGLSGVLPGYGHQRPNDWGLGFEIRDHKRPHWTGSRNSPDTFGHFGQSGTFCWVDPVAGLACVALTERPFGDWAIRAWPEFSDAVLGELAGAPPPNLHDERQ